MTIQVNGTVQFQNIGVGTWALVGEDGVTYELFNPPPELQQDGLNVQVWGQIRADVMSLAMIGPIFEVSRYQDCS